MILGVINEIRASAEWEKRLHLLGDDIIAAAVNAKHGTRVGAAQVAAVREANHIPSGYEVFQQMSRDGYSWDGSKWRKR